MSILPVKEQLVSLLDEACAETTHLVNSLDENRRQAQGAIDHWAIKDIIFHIAYWSSRDAGRMAKFRQGELVPETADALVVNDQVFNECKDATLEEALVRYAQAHTFMQAELDLLSEEDLLNTEKFPWTTGRPLYARIYGDGYSHPLVHLAQYQIEQGRVDEARRLNERMYTTMLALDDTPYVRGVAAYNLACFFALTGDSSQAVELLREAFPLAPSLVKWSQEDTDLVSLRELPGYKALLTDQNDEREQET